MSILIRNKPNTSTLLPPAGYTSWIDFWERRAGVKARYCTAVGCLESKDLVGAHVNKVIAFDAATYIIPLCKGHNAKTDSFHVTDTVFIRAS